MVDAQHAAHPDLSGYRRHFHKAVLLDEVASPSCHVCAGACPIPCVLLIHLGCDCIRGEAPAPKYPASLLSSPGFLFF